MMGSRKQRRRTRRFGAGSYARRHAHRNQAASGFVVTALAIGALTLHYFGFGIALAFTAIAAAACMAIRLRPIVAVYAVGCVLFASLVLAPNGRSPMAVDDLQAGQYFDDNDHMEDDAAELYVLESPLLGNGRVKLKMYERDATQQPEPKPETLLAPKSRVVPESMTF